MFTLSFIDITLSVKITSLSFAAFLLSLNILTLPLLFLAQINKVLFGSYFFGQPIFNLNIGCPIKYQPIKLLLSWAKKNRGKIHIFNDAKKAAKNSDVIFTDKVISMNDKVNKNKKIKDFKNFKVTKKIIECAKKDVIFLHCLPRGSEVSNEVFLGKHSKVWLQALNRVHLQKSILLYCLDRL